MNYLPKAVLALLGLAATLLTGRAQAQTMTYRDESHRPQFHFSPARNWMNDPNGLVYADGVYHLFFQQNPAAMQMGAIHWGHATSPDLIHWRQQPTALFPDRLGYIFSGSAVADTHNTSGLGKNGHAPLVALFTSHDPNQEKQGGNTFENQSLAYSLDKGRTWVKYRGNPVLKNSGLRDFRDPKVMWYAPGHKWVMALAAHDRIDLYSSPNLKQWTKESEFGVGRGAHGGVWECPDLIELGEGAQKRWVLLVSINPGGPNGGSATQYFVGDFDGKKFTSAQKDTRWIDYGPDDYAGVTWSNTGERRVFLGWMSNWLYGQQVPTRPWRGAMTIPRQLGLRTVGGSAWVTSQPVAEMDTITGMPRVWQNLKMPGTRNLSASVRATSGRFRLDLSVPRVGDWSVILSNRRGERVTLGYDGKKKCYFFDRSRSGKTRFAPGFARVATAPRIAAGPSMKVSLLVDTASAELFADDGLTCLTGVFFPHAPLTQVVLHGSRALSIRELKISGVRSIWGASR